MAFTHTESSEPERQVGYFERRPVEDINHAIERAKEKIDILQMDLASIKRPIYGPSGLSRQPRSSL